MNRKLILWTVAAFIAGGVYAARQSIVSSQKGQHKPAVAKKTVQKKAPAVPPKPSKPKEHDVSVTLIAQMPTDGKAKELGCGDTTVKLVRKSTFKGDPVVDALKVLFALQKAGYEDGKLYNALYQSNLKVQSVQKQQDVLTVKLAGSIKLGGECDTPRVKAQLVETIQTASSAKKIVVLVNDKSLDDVLSSKG